MKLKLAEETAEAERKAEEARKKTTTQKNTISFHVHSLNFAEDTFAHRDGGYDSSEECDYTDELTNDREEPYEEPYDENEGQGSYANHDGHEDF